MKRVVILTVGFTFIATFVASVILGFSLSPFEYIEHTVVFCFLLVTVPIHLSIYKILLLLIGKVYTVIKLIRVFNSVRTT